MTDTSTVTIDPSLLDDAFGRALDLPPNGWCGWTKDGAVEVSAADCAGSRADYADTPAYLYLDGRGRPARFPKAAGSGQAVCRVLGGGQFGGLTGAISAVVILNRAASAAEMAVLMTAGTLSGLYPTTEASKAVQLAADQAVVASYLENIDGGTIILGQTGTGVNATTIQTALGFSSVADLKTKLGTVPASGNWNSTTPPSKTDISAQVASDLATAHGSGNWTTASIPADYQQRGVAVTLPTAPAGYGGDLSDEQVAAMAAAIATDPAISAMATKVASFTTAPVAAVSPMATEVDAELTQYDDYLVANGRSLYWTNTDGSWAGGNLDGATITFTAMDSLGTIVCSKEAAATAETAPQRIDLELSSSESGLFVRSGKQYTYQVLIVKTGSRETRIEGSITVTLAYSVPETPGA